MNRRQSLLAVVLALASLSSAARADKAYVVASDQPAFAEAARAAMDALGGDAELVRADDTAKSIIAGASVVVAVGPLADRVVGAANGGSRVVECLTPRSIAHGSIAIPIRPSAAEVFGLLRQMLPSARKVAVFPTQSDSQIEMAAAARDEGLEPMFPRNDEGFAAAVDRLVDAADVIWIADATAVPNGGSALVVKKASDQKKPVIGPNRSTVQQGALFAVVPDPVAHGRAAGEAALRLLKGDDVHAVPSPNGRVVLNAALARVLDVKLSAALQRRTESVE